MSKILHNPTFQEVMDMVKNADSDTQQKHNKAIRDLPEVKMPKGIGFDGLERIQTHNYMEALGAFKYNSFE